MSKRLEDFIRNNRAQFDDMEPDSALWDQIANSLPLHKPNKTFSAGFVLRVAATIVLIMGVGFTAYIKLIESNVDLASINPEYAQQQAQYISLVKNKRNELKAITKADPQLYGELDKEFLRMDSVYKHLKKELPASPDREKVLRAMIQNLQIQTNILNQQLIMVEQYNKMKSGQKNEIKNI